MRKIVSNFQHVLVEGRQILNVILIANKDIDSRLKTIESGVKCKLDIKKAYDHSNHGFYKRSWKKLDLRWIKWCISMARFFALINGILIGFL